MGIYEELQARGLIAQVTNEPEIREMVNTGKATFYIGFDPTADSLHVGHFMALCLMKRLQMAGNRPVVLVGGGTGMVGDPSGRTDMRQMMTPETIQHNCDCFKKQMERFIDFGEGKAIMVNNADWLLKLNYIELLREVTRVIREHGYTVGNIDCTVIAQRPKLAPYIQQMREILAQAMGTELERVSVKATTEEKLGFTGEGLGIAAHAVALIE